MYLPNIIESAIMINVLVDRQSMPVGTKIQLRGEVYHLQCDCTSAVRQSQPEIECRSGHDINWLTQSCQVSELAVTIVPIRSMLMRNSRGH